jgi:hypothetical protein
MLTPEAFATERGIWIALRDTETGRLVSGQCYKSPREARAAYTAREREG